MKKTRVTLLKDAGPKVKASMCVMGLGQLMYGQIGKGLVYLAVLATGIYYLFARGFKDLAGLITLGTKEANNWTKTAGDNSIIMLLMGILAIIAVILFAVIYVSNVKDAYATQKLTERGSKPNSFRKDLAALLDRNFYKTVLFFPVLGVAVFSILPIIFMICIAFTNYGGEIVPPKLVDWCGFANFAKLASVSDIGPTFFKILKWNIFWAIVSTVLNYFLGMGLALLLNKDCVKGRTIWRAFPILAYAMPGFITLLGFKFMFAYGGPINHLITSLGGDAIGFLDIDAKWIARILGILINTWLSVPGIMLLCTGLLANMDKNLHEAAKIDGASRWKQFTSITLPYMLFTTTPVLISQFIGNFNNFGIFFFLRNGLKTEGYFQASDTDLLINWLYNLSISNNYYNIGAAVSLIIFIITSIISLSVYIRSSAYKEEDTFQ